MSYMKKSPTLVIFFLLILAIAFFGLSVFLYQKSLTRLNDNLAERDDTIDALNEQISGLSLNLSNLNSRLNLQIKREENLTGLYGNLKDEKEKVEDEKKIIQKKLNETQTQLYVAKIDIGNLETNIEDLNKKYNLLNISLYNAFDDIDDICRKSASMNISECNKYD